LYLLEGFNPGLFDGKVFIDDSTDFFYLSGVLEGVEALLDCLTAH
jgi:hypothetical protein